MADYLSRFYIGSVAYVKEKRKELVKDFHRLAYFGARLVRILDNSVTVHNGAESSLVVEVKQK